MSKNVAFAFLTLGTLGAAACGGSGGGKKLPDDSIECKNPSGCGKESFRRAIPSRKTVQVDYKRASQRLFSLDAQAQGYTMLGDHIDEINNTVDDIFEELENLASDAPDSETDTEIQWRAEDPFAPGDEAVLTLTSSDEATFQLEYAVGPTGFEPTDADTILSGEVHVADGEKTNFTLTVDYDTATEIDPDVGLQGSLLISAMPFDGDGREMWYDFHGFGEVGQPTADTRTTYWELGIDDGALEYLDSLHDSEATLYARWDGDGGRLDDHVGWDWGTHGPVDEISTDCWSAAGAETFSGWALFDDGRDYVRIDGDEGDCDFGPLADYAGDLAQSAFSELPQEGEWDDLAATSSPFCEDQPDDPDCISYCELYPEDCQ